MYKLTLLLAACLIMAAFANYEGDYDQQGSYGDDEEYNGQYEDQEGDYGDMEGGYDNDEGNYNDEGDDQYYDGENYDGDYQDSEGDYQDSEGDYQYPEGDYQDPEDNYGNDEDFENQSGYEGNQHDESMETDTAYIECFSTALLSDYSDLLSEDKLSGALKELASSMSSSDAEDAAYRHFDYLISQLEESGKVPQVEVCKQELESALGDDSEFSDERSDEPSEDSEALEGDYQNEDFSNEEPNESEEPTDENDEQSEGTEEPTEENEDMDNEDPNMEDSDPTEDNDVNKDNENSVTGESP